MRAMVKGRSPGVQDIYIYIYVYVALRILEGFILFNAVVRADVSSGITQLDEGVSEVKRSHSGKQCSGKRLRITGIISFSLEGVLDRRDVRIVRPQVRPGKRVCLSYRRAHVGKCEASRGRLSSQVFWVPTYLV